MREFVLQEDRLQLKVRDLINSVEFEIPYEEISFNKIVRQKKTGVISVVLAGFFSFMLLLNFLLIIVDNSELDWKGLLLFFVLTSLSWLFAYLDSKSEVLLQTSKGYIEIFDGRPTKEASDAFINNLKIESDNYLKSKYSVIDRSLPIEPQLANIIWLKERGILNNGEFEDLKNRLFGRQDGGNPIGFN